MKLCKQTILLFLALSPMAGMAKMLDLHEAPQNSSKIVGKLNTEMGVMPIYSPKESKWVKVADPSNGNVGWVELKDLHQGGFQFNVINSGDGKHFYQTIQYGGNTTLTREQMDKTIQDMHKRYEIIERDMHKFMQDMFANNIITIHDHRVPQKQLNPKQGTLKEEIKK